MISTTRNKSTLFMNIQTLRPKRSTIFKMTRLPVSCVIEIRIADTFSERIEPVSLKICVTNATRVSVLVREAIVTIESEIMSAFFACGVPKREK